MKSLVSKIVLVAAVAFALVFSTPAGSTLAATSGATISSFGINSATLSSDGKSVTLNEFIACSTPYDFQYQVYLQQGSLSGTGWQWVGGCNNTTQSNTITARVKGGGSFQEGVVNVQVYAITLQKKRQVERLVATGTCDFSTGTCALQ